MNRLILISCLIFGLSAKNQEIDKTGYLHQEEMDKSFGGWDGTLSWVVRDLVQEVKGYREVVSEQTSKIAAEIEGMKSDLKKALDQLAELDGMKSDLKNGLQQLDGLKNRIDVMRSEVRLISQQKLTWQNSTQGGRNYPDFAVDGVYRMAHDEEGMNPITHTDDNQLGQNNMVRIDLGALFKIHTVKLWKRTNTCCDQRNVGLMIYADDILIGATHEAPYLYNLRVKGDVYASKIYVKQPRAETVHFLEIQVFGTGPFGKDEIHC